MKPSKKAVWTVSASICERQYGYLIMRLYFRLARLSDAADEVATMVRNGDGAAVIEYWTKKANILRSQGDRSTLYYENPTTRVSIGVGG